MYICIEELLLIIFYVNVGAEPIGPPYGNAYGYYRKYGPSKDWKKIRLTDREVVDLVNLRFMSEYHKRTPEEIIEMRGRQSGFAAINDEILKARAKANLDKAKPNPAAKGNPDQGNRNRGAQGSSQKSRQ
jgi:hypothetical protein